MDSQKNYEDASPDGSAAPAPAPARRRVALPVFLFLATCATTFIAQAYDRSHEPPLFMFWNGLAYASSIMLILTAHELGHFFQAVRYRVPASLPFFIPMPFSPFGTMGAVIGMQAHMGNRRSLFDIAITGPIAGLIPSLGCLYIGLSLSELVPVQAGARFLGEPLVVQAMVRMIVGPRPPGVDVLLHPIAFAGWVGIFVTALNMIPIGQLDGGHVLYALLRRRAHVVAKVLLVTAAVAIVAMGAYEWTLMLLLLLAIGPEHPPTADDNAELSTARYVLGWSMLLFVVVGFTPSPFG